MLLTVGWPIDTLSTALERLFWSILALNLSALERGKLLSRFDKNIIISNMYKMTLLLLTIQ